jgi:hypothetical protein
MLTVVPPSPTCGVPAESMNSNGIRQSSFANRKGNSKKKPQISPLRYAPVEMTILFEDGNPRFQEKDEIFAATKLSSRPERTRISCHAALDTAACAAFVKESRMKFANATKFNRKSGVA